MKKNTVILVGVIIFFIIALIFFIFAMKLSKKENISQEDLPYAESQTKDIENVNYTDITIYDENDNETQLSEFKDMPVMLLFFNKENEDSMKVLKKVEDVYKNFEDKIKFIMINTAEEVDSTLKDEHKIKIYYDFYKAAARSYNVNEVPSMIFINKDNEVFNAKSGLISSDALDANLNILIENY